MLASFMDWPNSLDACCRCISCFASISAHPARSRVLGHTSHKRVSQINHQRININPSGSVFVCRMGTGLRKERNWIHPGLFHCWSYHFKIGIKFYLTKIKKIFLPKFRREQEETGVSILCTRSDYRWPGHRCCIEIARFSDVLSLIPLN